MSNPFITAREDTSQASADIDVENVLERASYYRERGTDEFLANRLAWLSESDAVRVQEVRPGAFDIVLCLDGRWFSRESAEDMRTFLAEEVAAVCAVLRAREKARTAAYLEESRRLYPNAWDGRA